MKKRFLRVIVSLTVVGCLLCGCNKEDKMQSDTLQNDKQQDTLVEETEEEVIVEQDIQGQDFDEGTFSFSDISNLVFDFSSGAGAWCTELQVKDDGSFEGIYHDSDMGDIGEGYPNGTVYMCAFSGKFSQPELVNDYTYSVRIEEMKLEYEVGTEEIEDDILFKYTEPYGLENADDIYIYLPGAPISELPQEYMNWVMFFQDATELPCYGMYNVNAQNGFSSCEAAEELTIDERLAKAEEDEKALNERLQKDDITQTEMNDISYEVYQLWDQELNDIWGRLEETLDEASMETLRAEEREWITMKEAEMKKAGAEFEGGSMQPLMESSTGAEMTKARVYELAKMLSGTE